MDGFQPLRVAMIGTGYVGLSTATALAYLGHHVVGVDKDEVKINLLRAGKSPIKEHGMEELLALSRDRLTFTQDTSQAVPNADLILIAVGTPSKGNGEADTRYVEIAAQEVAEAFLPGRPYVVVVKSTVPIGTNRRVSYVIRKVLEERGLSASTPVYIVSNPEFLREGTALYDTLYPDRIVVGAEEQEGISVMQRLYRPILEQTFNPPSFLNRPAGYGFPPMITTDPISAEMIKYASNAFLSLKISFINEIAGLCEKVGADVTEVARGMGLDKRIGPHFLKAGLGWGGSCFPKDTAALLAIGEEHGYEMPIVSASRRVNYEQRYRMVDKLQETLKGVRGRVIGVLGLSFKPGTDDIRESPSIDLVKILVERGAHVRAHDPAAIPNARKELEGLDVEFFSDPYDVAVGAEGLVLATDWSEYGILDLKQLAESMVTPVLLDARNMLDRGKAEEAGFLYMGVGR
ncbi:MAG: UDP-glucose/GDP-mannose dehydrogenase family protein [Bacillota bacterium]